MQRWESNYNWETIESLLKHKCIVSFGNIECENQVSQC